MSGAPAASRDNNFDALRLLAGALAFVSWHLVEGPVLRLKPRARSTMALATTG